MRYNLSIIIILVFMMACLQTQAQLDANKLIQFDELKGTPIRDILPDREGNIWIATQSGLVKFDGYKFKRFHPDVNDSTTMGELLTYTLFEDRNGYIWIGSQDAVYRYNPNFRSFKRYAYRNLIGVRDGFMSSILQITDNKRGRIYFGLATPIYNDMDDYRPRGLFYYDEKTEVLMPFELPDSVNLSNVYLMTRDPDDNIWIFGNSGFYKLDTLNQLENLQFTADDLGMDEDEYITGMKADSSGIIWVSSSLSKIRKYDPQTDSLQLVDLEIPLGGNIFNQYSDMLIDENQVIWFATQQGLIRFDREKSVAEVFDPGSKDRLLRDMATTLAIDDFGNLWIGTESVGLLKYNDRNLLGSFVWDDNDPSTITSGWVFRMAEDKQGNAWIATRGAGENAGISRLDLKNKTATPFLFSDIAPGMRVYDLYMGISPGKILLWTDQGIKNLDYTNMTLQDTVVELLNDSSAINKIVRDSHGNIWYCSYLGLIKQSGESGEIKHFDLTNLPFGDVNSSSVTNVYESPKHGLWIITDNGLFLYDYNSGQISRHGYDPEKSMVFPTQDINSLYESPEGICWVGTWQGGLCRYNPETGNIKTYNTIDGLPSMSIQGILGDEKNHALWLSTFNGISRFSTDDEQFNNFSLKDGIQGLLYADGQYMKATAGYFLFGGNNGITFFNPNDISENFLPPVTSITNFNVGDHSINIGPDVGYDVKTLLTELSWFQNNISIDYTGIQYDDPIKNKFAFSLENYDESWREVGNQRSAYYFNLPPGSYTFKVKAANSHGVWNKEPVTLSFTINPPWWLTWWAFTLYGILFLLLIFGFNRFMRRRLLEKQQKLARDKELAQAKEIEKAYHQLKQTQSQLIQSEKMASLGELTAGIAHEIQNPLNFVNNFAEVSSDIIEELYEEIDNDDVEEVKAIAKDLKENLEKISHHGHRASSIVKGMLEHSRTGSGEKVPTDIRALADEYLRLAYHGLRAKDKSFNADFKLEADDNLPKVNVVPQDIGRVLLNLINNAFHAVNERNLSGLPDQETYKPQVVVTLATSHLQGGLSGVTIRVADNGPGIPEQIRDKIFQPFFTTKPTGQGTGLGLSLSYDIITKGHGGELSVKSKQGAGAEFIIHLPTKIT